MTSTSITRPDEVQAEKHYGRPEDVGRAVGDVELGRLPVRPLVEGVSPAEDL